MAILSPPSVVLMGQSHCHLLPILPPFSHPWTPTALRCPFILQRLHRLPSLLLEVNAVCSGGEEEMVKPRPKIVTNQALVPRWQNLCCTRRPWTFACNGGELCKCEEKAAYAEKIIIKNNHCIYMSHISTSISIIPPSLPPSEKGTGSFASGQSGLLVTDTPPLLARSPSPRCFTHTTWGGAPHVELALKLGHR